MSEMSEHRVITAQASTDSSSLRLSPAFLSDPTAVHRWEIIPVNHRVQSAVTSVGREGEKKHFKMVHCLKKYILATRKEACDPLHFKGMMINLILKDCTEVS